MIYKYKTTRIYPGKGWIDDGGIQHPGNWNIWSSSEKTAKGITEIIEDTPPDGRLYTWTKDSNGCLLYTSPSPRDATLARMPSSA